MTMKWRGMSTTKMTSLLKGGKLWPGPLVKGQQPKKVSLPAEHMCQEGGVFTSVLHGCKFQNFKFVAGCRSAASNFDLLTATLCDARDQELAIEERKLKSEEARFAFECEKWEAQRPTYAEVVIDENDDDAAAFAEFLRARKARDNQ